MPEPRLRKPSPPGFPALVQQFFTEYLVAQRALSPRTVASYRDAMTLFPAYVTEHLGKTPMTLRLTDITPELVLRFLAHLERERHNSVRSRNLRLTALRAFLKFAGRRDVSALHAVEQVMAVPMKRFERPLLGRQGAGPHDSEVAAAARRQGDRVSRGRVDRLRSPVPPAAGISLRPMNRRSVVACLGTALSWPLPGPAQQPAMPLIGFLHEGSVAQSAHAAAAFRQGLSEAGYVEGRNVAIEYRWAEGRYERLPALAAELVRLRVLVIAGGGGPRSVRAAKAATTTIPIVFTVGVDPIEFGLVPSLNRPEGNATGVTMFTDVLTNKRLELLRELLPALTSVAFLVNRSNPNAEPQTSELQRAARALGLRLDVSSAGSDSEIDAAFAAIDRQRAGALIVSADPFLSSRRDRLVTLAARHAVPAIYQWRDFSAIGGLMSYGSSNRDAYRQTGVYAGRILQGAKPADLPVLQPTRFELVINLRTAKALGITIPQTLLLRADEVIE